MDVKEIGAGEYRHPWELSRAECILGIIPQPSNTYIHTTYIHTYIHTYADIGSGDNYFAKKLLDKTQGKVFAVDLAFPDAQRDDGGVICLNNIEKLEDKSIDCVLLMDVLEHVEDEGAFLKGVLNKLSDNGSVVITVPAWQFLWSPHDSFVGHFRRYRKGRLLRLLVDNNLIVEKSHYFYTSLFVLSAITLVLKTLKIRYEHALNIAEYVVWDYSKNDIRTKMAKIALNVDFFINKVLDKLHIHLPGLSILAVCKKNRE
ncbi:hypothetical protein RsTz2092_02600 [Deferribacterales bacterium RsTz2092]|nr:hypothetical protein AGMMS49941_08620 [Deferribacterales bacterium]